MQNHQDPKIGEQKPKPSYAALLIDMQEEYVAELSQKDRELIIPSQIAVIRYCAANKIPVILIEHDWDVHGSTIRALQDAYDSAENRPTVYKDYANVFTNTDLDSILKSLSVNYLLLMGMNASGCVKHTALGARGSGYGFFTSAKLIADAEIVNNRVNDSNKSRQWYIDRGILVEKKTFVDDYAHPEELFK